MTAPKLRIAAGPNGSGKTTLFTDLRTRFQFNVGFFLNPDDLDRELVQTRRVDLTKWGITADTTSIHDFMRGHPLAAKAHFHSVSIDDHDLVVSRDFEPGYVSVIICDFLRQLWLEARASFSFETVMSHPAKIRLLDAAAAAGYRTYLYFICTELPVINVERVRSRAQAGGHDVPEHKIVERYHRSLDLLPSAVGSCHRSFMFDNSEKSHRFIAEYEAGQLIRVQKPLPSWFVTALLSPQGAR